MTDQEEYQNYQDEIDERNDDAIRLQGCLESWMEHHGGEDVNDLTCALLNVYAQTVEGYACPEHALEYFDANVAVRREWLKGKVDQNLPKDGPTDAKVLEKLKAVMAKHKQETLN